MRNTEEEELRGPNASSSKPTANPNVAFPHVAVRGAENRASLVSWKRVTCKHLALGAGGGGGGGGGRGVDQDAYGLISAKIRREADKMRIKASTMRRREREREGEKAQEFALAFREENAGRC